MKQKKHGTIIICLFAAAAFFLVVPFITTESGMDGKGINIADGALPLEGSTNPVAKYFERLAEFYNLKSKKNPKADKVRAALSAKSDNAVYVEGEELSPAQFEAALSSFFSSSSPEEAEKALKELGLNDKQISSVRASYDNFGESADTGVVYTKGGLELKPQKDGYFYKGKFYKNGSYPDNKHKSEIETALSRYHKWQAGKEGFVPAYMKDENGNLMVSYMPREKFNEAQNATDRRKYWGLSGDDDYYAGARIISRNGDSSKFSSNNNRSLRSKSKSFGDMASLYASVSSRLQSHSDSSDTRADYKDEEKPSSTVDCSKELIAKSRNIPPSIMRETERKENPNTIEPEYYTANKFFVNVPLGNNMYRNQKMFLHKYGIDFKEQKPLDYIHIHLSDEDGGKSSFDSQMQDKEGKKLVFFPVGASEEMSKLFADYEKQDFRFIYPHDPYVDVNERGQPKIMPFSTVFFNRTGLNNMFTYMGVSSSEVTKLEEGYQKLDMRRAENDVFLQAMGQDKNISKKMPKIVFYLGKVPSGNDNKIGIASPSSYHYAYAPNMAPDFVAAGDTQSNYQTMDAAAFIENLNRNTENNIVVVTDKKIIPTLNNAGVKNVVFIENRTLSSGAPNDIEEVLNILTGEMEGRVLADKELKEEFEKKKELIGVMKAAKRKELQEN